MKKQTIIIISIIVAVIGIGIGLYFILKKSNKLPKFLNPDNSENSNTSLTDDIESTNTETDNNKALKAKDLKDIVGGRTVITPILSTKITGIKPKELKELVGGRKVVK